MRLASWSMSQRSLLPGSSDGLRRLAARGAVLPRRASPEAQGCVFEDVLTESRLVYVFGHSNPQQKKRDDYRLRGWIGRTNQAFGTAWDPIFL